MFSLNKTVVCVEFTKTYVFCALAQISGRKVDILAVDSIHIETGILEEGVVYDIPHLEQIVKNLITSVSKTHNKVDGAWISIPDNKIQITKFDLFKDKKGISEDLLHKTIEEKFNFSASKLMLINRPVHELNNHVFYLSNAIRIEHLEPFLEIFDGIGIPVDAVFPTFQCIFEDLKPHFTAPSLLLYPTEKGFKFLIADENGVHLESVWGHNVIEFNENFDKAIEEVIQYAKQSKEVALGVKQILVIESEEYDSDTVQIYLQRTKLEYKWISQQRDENGLNPISILILKGLLKAAMAQNFNQGFLEEQIVHEYERTKPIPTITSPFNLANKPLGEGFKPAYTTPFSKDTVIKDDSEMESRWDKKVVLATVLLIIGLLGILVYGGTKLSGKISKKTTDNDQNLNVTPEPTQMAEVTPTPSPTPITTPTPIPTTVVALEKKDVKVQVLNGNSKAGEAARISTKIQSSGYTMLRAGNNPTKVPSTTVTYKDARAESLAKEIVTLIVGDYPTAKAVLDPNASVDILVVLGGN